MSAKRLSRRFHVGGTCWSMLALGCLSACGVAGEGSVDAGQQLDEEPASDPETGDLPERLRPCPDDGNACTVELRHGSRCDSQPKGDGTPCPTGACASGQCVSSCGDAICAAGEGFQSCPADCSAPEPAVIEYGSDAYSVGEGGGVATVVVTRSGGMQGAAAVEWGTNQLTALRETDYAGVGWTRVDFAPGEAQRSVVVTILDDSLDEPDETFRVVLRAVAPGTLVGTRAG